MKIQYNEHVYTAMRTWLEIFNSGYRDVYPTFHSWLNKKLS